MSVTYDINDTYCPKGHKWIFVPSSLLFSDCYYCKACDKIYQPTVKEVTKKYFEENFNTDRFNDIKEFAEFIEAKEKIRREHLVKLGLLA